MSARNYCTVLDFIQHFKLPDYCTICQANAYIDRILQSITLWNDLGSSELGMQLEIYDTPSHKGIVVNEKVEVIMKVSYVGLDA